ncbi:AMP-binding protein [Ferrovum sp.]|uniref:AMP-binding protein n=1 Tax=Ferrovum sp. TaxID=2609467 RepID=UPI00261D82D4|nr:AMP-binding protein [Ferrovum sp.]
MRLLSRIVQHAESRPDAPAVIGLKVTGDTESTLLSYGTLLNAASHLVTRLRLRFDAETRIGLAMSNSAEWIVADLALMLGHLVEVPVPMAFSAEQAAHLLRHCAVVLTDRPGSARLAAWRGISGQAFPLEIPFDLAEYCALPPKPMPMPRESCTDGICKIIHTSGTTNRPKGVRIRRHGLDALLNALWTCAEEHDYRRYLSLVPFSLLIEQVTALYMPFASGGAVLLPPVSLPPVGSPGVCVGDRLDLIKRARPSALTLTPAMVEAIAEKGEEVVANPVTDTVSSAVLHHIFGQEHPPFLAAGGGPLDPALLHKLADWGIPVYQGYGLSENSSVATWNRRSANRIGTVGQPLPHVEVKLTDDGELYLRSTSLFAGYCGSDPSSCSIDEAGWLHTGDLATIDDGGYVSIIGRRKTLIITSNGRNISPEWLESRYRSVAGVAEAVVFGDRRQFLSGVFLCREGADPHETSRAIRVFAEAHLSEIERIADPILVPDSPEVRDRLFTVTGRPRRDAIEEFVRSLNP